MRTVRLMLLFIYLVICSPLYSQDIDSMVNTYEAQLPAYPEENIYLQTSKGIYETGEDLWFKAYQLDSRTFELSGRSKTLYLQMQNNRDSVVWQEKYSIQNGITTGHIYIDENLPEGDYFLQGYTNHSFYRNDTTSILSARKVKIVKEIASEGTAVPVKDTEIRFGIFPEGGNLIYGITSKVAFKATDGKGIPVETEGAIYQNDSLLTSIQTTHHGMGSIQFCPLPDKEYRIELGNGQSFPFPEIQTHGMSLQLFRQHIDKLEFIISKSENLPDQQIYLVGQIRGIICCVAGGRLKDNLKIAIPLNNFLYQGITEFTLFDEQYRPVAERLVYIHPEKKLYITAEPEKKSFGTREKAEIKIKVTDENGEPVQAHLGISVYDRAYANAADPVNIMTHYYLSSQIRGKIYDPFYYLDENNKTRTYSTDLLLLTQGWRRYIWNTENAAYAGEPFLTDEITGVQIVKSRTKNAQNSTQEQFIMVSGAEGNSTFIETNDAGVFAIGPETMKDLEGGYVYLKPMMPTGSKPELKIDDLFPEIEKITKSRSRFYPDSDLSTYRKELNLNQHVVSKDSTILLEEVTITGKTHRPFRDKFMGRLDSLAKMDVGMPWVCPDGHLENYKDGYTCHHDPRYCPNATIVPPEDRSLPVEGETYYIMKPKYFENGAFIVEDAQWVTYKGPIFSEEELLRKNNIWRTKGYYATREFYEPDEFDMYSPIPDARNTLLWAPSVITDENGEATVSFYCSDINTGYIGVIEGVDVMGLLGTTKCEFRVMRY